MTKTTAALATLALLLAGLAFRLYDLKADPPALFGGGGQDLTTDAAYLTLHARNATLFDSFDLYGFERWPAFKVSLVTGLTYLLFLLFGASATIASIGGVLLQALAIFLFWLSLKPSLSRSGQLWFLLFACLSWVLIVFARLPFSENAMLALAGATMLVYLRVPQMSGLVVTGVAVALTGLLGKSFGYLLLIGIAWDVWAKSPSWPDRLRHGALVLGSTLATIIAFSALFHGESSVFDFLWQHSAGQHGFPHGLSSPLGYLENLISFSRTGFHQYTPVLSALAWFFLIARLIGAERRPLDTLDRLLLGWLLAWVLILSVFNYLPIRYLMPLVIPMAILVARWLSTVPPLTKPLPRISYLNIGFLILLNWYATYNILKLWLVNTNDIGQHFRVVWIGAIVGLALTALFLMIRKPLAAGLSSKSRITLTLIALLFLGVEGYRSVSWLGSASHTIAYAAADVSQLVSSDAVISGQYGPTVTSDSRVRAFPHFFGVDPTEDMAMLRRYPITHIAISNADLDRLQKAVPQLARAEVVTSFWMRDNVVSLLRTAEVGGNAKASAYRKSEFETCISFRYRQESEIAYTHLDTFLIEHPFNRTALLERYYLLSEWGQMRECRGVIDTLTARYDDDFTVAILGAVYYRWLANETGERALLAKAETMFASAVQANPANRENLEMIYHTYSPRHLTAPIRERRR